jgi:hypothetical protein
MKRLRRVASVAALLFLSLAGDACADPFDGQWNGLATPTSGRCRPATVTITVGDKVGIGQISFQGEKQEIRGTVTKDGAFGATIGFQRLTGSFVGNTFEGSFNGNDCVWKIVLKRTR